MADLCYNSKKFVRKWFDNLEKLQEKMSEINNLTKTNCKEFSHQKLDDLLMKDKPGYDIREKTLTIFFRNILGFEVPDDAYSDLDKDFMWLLTYITSDPQAKIYRLAYCVATKFDNTLPVDMPDDFTDKKLGDVFNKQQSGDSPGLKMLDSTFSETFNISFYQPGSTLNLSMSIKDNIDKILN